MSYLKTLGLLAVAAATLMAFAGVASATVVMSNGVSYTSTITAESSNSALSGSFITVSCTGSHVEGKVESHGASVTAEGKISKLSFSGCNYSVTVKKAGTLIAHGTSGGNGTITSTGAEIAIHTSVGECVFTTNGTSIGTLTGGTSAKLDIGSSSIPRTGGSFFCGSTGKWEGDYTVKTPGNLSLDEGAAAMDVTPDAYTWTGWYSRQFEIKNTGWSSFMIDAWYYGTGYEVHDPSGCLGKTLTITNRVCTIYVTGKPTSAPSTLKVEGSKNGQVVASDTSYLN